MKKTFWTALVLFTLILSSCEGGTVGMQSVRGSGSVTTEDRPVSGISRVSLETLGDLTIEMGGAESLQVEAEDNLLPYIETRVSGGTLSIGNQERVNLRPTKPVRYRLTVKSLDSLSISSSGNITAPALDANRFSADISSSGDITIAGLNASSLDISISSSGDVTIESGEVESQSVSISSSGDYLAGDVSSQTARVTISSSGSATVWVSGQLTANISSSGNVNYYGSPKVNDNISSSGKMVALGAK